MTPKHYNVLDLFCGTGALSYGLVKSAPSLKTVGGIDANFAATETAKRNHPTANILCKKIEDVSPDEMLSVANVSTVDVVVGGPPCQGFSSLRPSRGEGLEDPRNTLYKNFVKYVSVLRPRVFLMENVVGILGASSGALVHEMLAAFGKAGYSTDWRVMNSANFGVPQKRERFFLVGVRRNLGRAAIPCFPKPTHRFSGRVIGTRHKDRYVTNASHGEDAVTVSQAISDLPSLESGEAKTFYRSAPENHYQEQRRRDAPEIVTLHTAASHSRKMIEVMRHAGASMSALPEGLVSSGYSSCYSRLDANAPATTITVKFTSPASNKCIHPLDDRAITPREAARLQSFDDSFEFYGSKTEIASQIGNAVPPLFGEAFGPVIEEIIQAQGIGEH